MIGAVRKPGFGISKTTGVAGVERSEPPENNHLWAHFVRPQPPIISQESWYVLVLPAIIVALQCTCFAEEVETTNAWIQTYNAGYRDGGGMYAGGSEIMHIVSHVGKLFAANGYWEDSRWKTRPYDEKQSAQVLRLDASEAKWQVDLDLGETNGLGLRYMKGNILKSVTFTRDERGDPLPKPKTLLVMASGAYTENDGVVSAWTRNDSTSTWTHALVQRGSRANHVRWVPRDMEIYRDKITGVERLFLLLGDPGIISGVYDESLPHKIRWDKEIEFPQDSPFPTRPLGIIQANGKLLFSVGGTIYRRKDGADPTYSPLLDLGDGVNTDVGGIRGLTTIANPNGRGESILFLWAPNGTSSGQIKRLDPDADGGYTVHNEANMREWMAKHLDVEVGYVLGAHSNMYPIKHPSTGETVHLIGIMGNLRGGNHLKWKGSRLYAGAMYAIRRPDQTYSIREVNGQYSRGKPVLVTPRAFAASPFGDGSIFVGGHDASFKPSDDMAWIFRASVADVLERRVD